MALTKGYKALLDEAYAEIETVPVDQAKALLEDPDVLFVDIRDIRELERMGVIPGAVHAPRGMLEFWVDPDSPYHKEVFAQNRKLILFCAAAWRSALACKQLQDMGYSPAVAHLEGGFKGWTENGGPVAEKEPRK